MTGYPLKLRSAKFWKFWPLLLYGLVFLMALLRVHIRVETTLIGYQVGKLKAREIELIHQKSLLTMKLAKLTTKQNLINKIGQ